MGKRCSATTKYSKPTGMLISCIVIGIVTGISLFHHLGTKHWPDITTSLWNDALFADKNKAYGAYKLRDRYNQTLLFIQLLLILSILIPLTPALFQEEITIQQINQMRVTAIQHTENFTDFDPNTDNTKPGQKGRNHENAPPKKLTASSTAFISAQQLILDTTPQKSDGKTGSGAILPKKNIPPLTPRKLHHERTDENGVPDSVPYPAQFKGGNSKLFEFVSEYAKLQPKGYGTVEVQFLIDRFGNIKKIWIEKESKNCPQCDRAAIDVVKQMPAWEPARLNNTPVNSYHKLQITFR